MKAQRIRLRNIGPYRELAELDLDALGPGLIAVAGGNGQGKTTLLSAVPGGIYGTTPDRGPIATMATARDSMVELFGDQGGHAFHVVQSFDAHNGKREAVLEWDGEPVAGPKVRDFQAAIEARFAPYSVYLSAAFSAQSGVGSVLRMDRKDRRDLFSQLLGIQRLEDLATAAREKARQTEQEMSAARAALEAVRGGAADVASLQAALASARGEAARAAGAQRDAADKLRAVQAERERLTSLFAEVQRAERAAQEVERRAEGAREAVERLERQVEALAPILARAEAVRADVAVSRKLEADLVEARAKAQAGRERADMVEQHARQAAREAGRLEDDARDIRDRIGWHAATLAQADEIRAAVARLTATEAEVERVRANGEAAAGDERAASEAATAADRAAASAMRASSDAHDAVESEKKDAADIRSRVAAAEAAMWDAPCAGVLADDVRDACSALVGHARIRDDGRRQLAELDARLPQLEAAAIAANTSANEAIERAADANAAARVAKTEADRLRGEYRRLRGDADTIRARLGERPALLAKAEAEVGVLQARLTEAEQAAEDAQTRAEDISRAALHERATATDLDDRVKLLSKRREVHAGDADWLRSVERAESEAAGLRGRLEAAGPAASEAAEAARRLRASVPAVDMAALSAAEVAVAGATEAAGAADMAGAAATRRVAVVETQLEAAHEAQEKAAQLVAKVAPLERDLAEWRWLARALGKEGIQALEIDSSGPQVSDLANTLLQEAYGGRFVLRLDTQSALANGHGVKEDFRIVVLDMERGREGDGEDLSGGERVVIGEALGLAISLFHGQRAGHAFETCIRDETVGALDPDNAERYFHMLRVFLRLGHVQQLLAVVHNPALLPLADRVVRIEAGRILVEG
jgi:exonuclease SbcC